MNLHVCLLFVWSAGRSVIISLKGREVTFPMLLSAHLFLWGRPVVRSGALRLSGASCREEPAGGGQVRGRGQDLPLRHAEHDGLHRDGSRGWCRRRRINQGNILLL